MTQMFTVIETITINVIIFEQSERDVSAMHTQNLLFMLKINSGRSFTICIANTSLCLLLAFRKNKFVGL